LGPCPFCFQVSDAEPSLLAQTGLLLLHT
jgi:hypothetical protein